jgi:GTP cyclohydrolase I/GTP cyclohydrolase-4
MDSWPDIQASAPAVPVSLSRAGVSQVEKVIRIGGPGARSSRLYSARLDCFVDLGPEQKGVHMSRFEEAVNDVIGEVILGEVALRAEVLARHIAQRVRQRQDALRAEVTIRARYPEHKPAPVSGIATQEMYTLYASAVAFEHGTRQMVGVAAQGMTTHPGAQQLIADGVRERLAADGFSDRQIDRILAAVPIVAESARGLGTLHIGCPEHCDVDIDAADLLTIVEDSMSSEVYELLKRSDERAVIEKAHRRPRFVEDCVREMLRAVLDRYGHLPDDAFVSARHENLRTVHQHNVVAERYGLLGDLRAEGRGGDVAPHHTSRREWLEAVGAPPASDRPLA